jgi:hypothetical protein
MSGSEVAELVATIDESIASSDERIQAQVAAYVEAHPDDVGEQIAEKGVAVIPTFAGNYMLTEAQLKEIAGDSVQLEAVAH